MKSIIVRTDNLSEIFKHYYFKATGVILEDQYLLNSKSRIYIENKHWVGNVVVNADCENFRYSQICDSKKAGLFNEILGKSIPADEVVEISCIAFSNYISEFKRLRIYFNTIYDAVSTKKKYIIGGSVNLKIIKRFQLVLPHELATIEGVKIEGHEANKTLYLVYGESKGIAWRFIKALPHVLLRSLRKWVFKKKVAMKPLSSKPTTI